MSSKAAGKQAIVNSSNDDAAAVERKKKKKKRKQSEIAEERPEPVFSVEKRSDYPEGDPDEDDPYNVGDDDDDNDGDDDEEEEEAQPLGLDPTEEEASLNIEFGFFDPKESDFHGIRALLASGGVGNSLLPSGAGFDVGGLAGCICEQAAVGSIAKVIAPGSEEPADPDDVLGFLSAINLHAHRTKTFAKELLHSFTGRCADGVLSEANVRMKKLLDAPTSGLIVSARMLNLPPALVPDLYDSLLQDITWAVENCDEVAERESFGFTHLILVCSCQQIADPGGGGGDGGSSSSAGGGGGGGKKKKKQKSALAAAAFLESLEFARPEEEVLAAAAEWSVLLNAHGKERQLLLSLTPEAIRNAIPALRGVCAA